MNFTKEKKKYLNMNLAEKREEYYCKASYVTLDDIPTWTEYSRIIKRTQPNKEYKADAQLNDKVSIFVGDIKVLEIDAIVNSSNRGLLCSAIIKGDASESTKVINGGIHRAAGSSLSAECISLNGCGEGEARITGGYKLPAKYIIHTVGPVGLKPILLRNCYLSCLNLAKENGLKTVAFPSISTGQRGYPNRSAAQVALSTVREFLEENVTEMDRIIFGLFESIDVRIYESLMQNYFPV
ncbi:O-acetyl-ADP-ribose deacetylase MACROD1 [Araneus ventricosus]|uniref:O-acetyl-ADP-ribose deacetylase MACROD1 n=1 Tax=Araneus ventricosus TaxID=182803 RepID=A0A4Y2HDV8_ARAVE|nr:O-acetyl-ADP-ribose deacetylase MACROD1 [Araneus ventricosus]